MLNNTTSASNINEEKPCRTKCFARFRNISMNRHKSYNSFFIRYFCGGYYAVELQFLSMRSVVPAYLTIPTSISYLYLLLWYKKLSKHLEFYVSKITPTHTATLICTPWVWKLNLIFDKCIVFSISVLRLR